MSDQKPLGRGRGRGQQRAAVEPPVAAGPSRLMTRPSTTTATASASLLGPSEFAKKPAGSVKTKFAPNTKRMGRLPSAPAPQVKTEEGEKKPFTAAGRGRGRGAFTPRERVEQTMSASGPMGQGPVGPPRTAARSYAPGGAGVMNNSTRSATHNTPAAFDDPDDSDFDDADEDDETKQGRPKDLGKIGEEEEMAPIILPQDPAVLKASKERKYERMEKRIKNEPKSETLIIDDNSTVASTTATPAPGYEDAEEDTKKFIQLIDDTKPTPSPAPTLASTSTAEEIKPEPNILANFTANTGEQLHVFQFPRQFPNFVLPTPSLSPSSEDDPTKPSTKDDEDDKPLINEKKKKTPPAWGKAGSRSAKGSRFSKESGMIGHLVLRESGRVTFTFFGDMQFEVLPAADPNFLQEVIVLDHDPALVPRPSLSTPAPRSEPTRAFTTMGQTARKFIVVPDVSHLLKALGVQEKEEKRERDAEKKLKKAKKEEEV